jgi:hypothetical protein
MRCNAARHAEPHPKNISISKEAPPGRLNLLLAFLPKGMPEQVQSSCQQIP